MAQIITYLSVCLTLFSLGQKSFALPTVTESTGGLYGDNACSRQVLEPSYNTTHITFGCWKNKVIDCDHCHGPRCHRVPLQAPSAPGWAWSMSTSWPGISKDPFTGMPPWMSSSWWDTTTTEWMSNSWWETTTAALPWGSTWSMWTQSWWWSSSSQWSQGWWPSSSSPSWSDSWNPWTTTEPDSEFMCFTRELGQCFTIQSIKSHCYKEVQYCCEGYQQFGQICVETEHCMGHNGGCGQMCSDGNSGPQCSCWDGFTSDDYTGCDDVDECSMYPNICDQSCVNTPGSFYCECYPGYMQSLSGKCEPINRCRYGNGGCEHHCVNTSAGEHYCKCEPGFTLRDGYRCEDPKYEEFLRTREAKEKQDGFSTPQIVGIIIGCICAVALIILVVMLAVKLYGRRSAAPPALTTETGDTQFSNPGYMKKVAAISNNYETPGDIEKVALAHTYDSLKNENVYDNPVEPTKGEEKSSVHITQDKLVHTEY